MQSKIKTVYPSLPMKKSFASGGQINYVDSTLTCTINNFLEGCDLILMDIDDSFLLGVFGQIGIFQSIRVTVTFYLHCLSFLC